MGKVLRASLWGGLAGGAIDIVYACIVGWVLIGATPDRVLKFVGAGWIGLDAARAGGMEIAALGLASHFAICIVFALAYCAASLAVPLLRSQAIGCGMIYGIVLFLVMNFIVVPHSALAGIAKPPEGWRLAGELASHILGVGMAIGYFARREIGRA